MELAPPRDNVSLSPPCDKVHIKQVSPTNRGKKAERKQQKQIITCQTKAQRHTAVQTQIHM
jgi:hypothetical protein